MKIETLRRKLAAHPRWEWRPGMRAGPGQGVGWRYLGRGTWIREDGGVLGASPVAGTLRDDEHTDPQELDPPNHLYHRPATASV